MSSSQNISLSETESAILSLGIHALLNKDLEKYAIKQQESQYNTLDMQDFNDMVVSFKLYLSLANKLNKRNKQEPKTDTSLHDNTLISIFGEDILFDDF